MLVIGGTPITEKGTRMVEDAFELEPCLDLQSYESLKNALHQKDLEKIKKVLKSLSSQDINLVGSRGYVYRTKRLAELIDEVVAKNNFLPSAIFPRTMGLRKTITEIHNSKSGE